MKKLLLIFFSVFFISFFTNAQTNSIKRIEYPASNESGYKTDDVIALGQNGLVKILVEVEASDGKKEWVYDVYDTDLNLIVSKKVYINEKFSKKITCSTGKSIHTIHLGKGGNYTLVSFEIHTGNFYTVEGKIPKKEKIYQIKVLEDFIYMRNSFDKSNIILSVNWKTGEERNSFFDSKLIDPGKIVSKKIQILEQEKEVLLYIKVKSKKLLTSMYVIILNNKGQIIKTLNLSEVTDYHLSELSASKTGADKYVFIGLFKPFKDKKLNDGIFFCYTDNQEIKIFKSYKLDYKGNIQEGNFVTNAGYRDLRLPVYDISPNEMIKLNDDFYFWGEVYENKIVWNSYYNMYEVDEYIIKHFYIARFNKEGEFMGSGYKGMYIHTSRPSKQFAFHIDNSSLTFFNENQYKVHIITINPDELMNNLSNSSSEIENGSKIKNSLKTYESTSYWYDNYFIVYGYETYKEEIDEKTEKKGIYFINKVQIN